MDYLFQQHYSMPLVMLVEPEPEALALYSRHLVGANLLVSGCLEFSQLLSHIRHNRPQLLIVNPSSNLVSALAMLQQVAQAHPALPIITIGSAIPDAYLDRLMAIGIAFHLNRTLTQPRDIAVAAKQILELN